MNFTADLRPTQVNNTGFYFASRICSVNADFSVSTFPFQRLNQISKKYLHFFNTNQVTHYISSNSKLMHYLCPSSYFSVKMQTDLVSNFKYWHWGIIKMQKHWFRWTTKLIKGWSGFLLLYGLLYVFLITNSLASWIIHNNMMPYVWQHMHEKNEGLSTLICAFIFSLLFGFWFIIITCLKA